VYQNGASAAERPVDKETSLQRLDRYIAEFRRKALREIETRMTGHVSLTVNMQEGSPLRRQVITEEVTK
jgi:hypothetical protein